MYRQPLFSVGQTYQAKWSFTSGPTSFFVAGETLVFVSDSYSPYDDAFVYLFRAEDGTEKQWWLGDGDPKETWTRYFELVPTPVPS